MLNFSIAHANVVLYALAGGIIGFGYHRFIGCRSGACLIWTNPYVSTLYGALLGFLLASGGR